MSDTLPNPRRGEVWLVQFSPSVAAEIQKARPALVLSRDDVGKLPLRVIVPFSTYQNHFEDVPWLVAVEGGAGSGLDHKSVADCFQPRSFAVERFMKKRGALSTDKVDEIARTVAEVLGVEF